ncbi:MAG: hypothetical protein SAqTSA_21080 [Shewanella algae]
MTCSKFDWSKEANLGNEKLSKDEFGREKYARYLSNLLISKGTDSNYVLNLDSEWGSGKTYFIKRLASELKDSFPVVYIDAWQQDYSDDPLLTVVSSILSQLKEQAGPEYQKKFSNISERLATLFKATAPAIAGSVAKRCTGIDFSQIFDNYYELFNSDEIDKEVEVSSSVENKKANDGSAVASSLVKFLISEHESKSKAVDALKTNVTDWIAAVNEKSQKRSPAFIFIDELDRCRPSYAVEMLETIKHLFNIPGTVFVVATDTKQLQHSIRVLYGSEFAASLYLSRFFDAKFTLARPCFKNFILMQFPSDFKSLDDKCLPFLNHANTLPIIFSDIFKAFGFSAREVRKLVDRFFVSVVNVEDLSAFNLVYFMILLSIYERSVDIFESMMQTKMPVEIDNSKSFFDLVGGVDWDGTKFPIFLRKDDIYFDEIFGGDFINALQQEDVAIEFSMKQFFFYNHLVYSEVVLVSSLLADLSSNISKFPNLNCTSMKYNKSKVLSLIAYSGLNKGVNLSTYLDMVKMSASIDQLYN